MEQSKEQYLSLVDNIYRNRTVDDEKKRSKLKVPHPQCARSGKTTLLTNFLEIVNALKCKKEHLKKYIEKELIISSSILGDNSLKLGGRFNNNQIQRGLVAYIKSFVVCRECKSFPLKPYKFESVSCDNCHHSFIVD